MLSGSVAMSVYVVPRTTRDMDFIVHLQLEDVDKLVTHFNKDFYCDKDAIKDAIMRKSMFNIIDHMSQYKADFVLLKDTEYRQLEFSRRLKVDFLGMPVFVVAAEDLLLSKLIWIQTLQSGRQLEDIQTLAALETLDRTYIKHWTEKLNLNTFNLTL